VCIYCGHVQGFIVIYILKYIYAVAYCIISQGILGFCHKYAAVLIGSITGHARSSVCLSVCPVQAPNSKTKRRGKPKLGSTLSMAGVTDAPIF